VTASGDASLRLIRGNTVQPVSLERIPSYSTIDPRLQEAAWHFVDGKHYGVPYQWGPNVLLYNTKIFKKPPTSWSVTFEAQKLPSDRRAPVYQRIADRMGRELRDDPANGAANYWQVVAARGVGDLDRAWSAAIAGWVRSTLDPAGTAQLRVDLDRVVEQALIPERARSNPVPEGPDQVETLRAEWALVKQNWK